MPALVTIAGRPVGPGHPPFLIAEIGANHDGDPEVAHKMIDVAADAGADAIKLQTYTSEDLVADKDREVTWGPVGHQVTEKIGPMFDRVALPRDAHAKLFEHASQRGLIGFSTPFSVDGVGFLDGLGVPCFKVAASDFSFEDMLAAIAATGKPTILSLGKSTLADADQAVRFVREHGLNDLILLHCVAQYPAPMDEMNLRTIPALAGLYPNSPIGLSDHSIGITAALGAIAVGGSIVEKHYTLDKARVGPDHWFSADPAELTALAKGMKEMGRALGGVRAGILPSEISERRDATRSLVAAVDIPAGTPVTKAHLKAVRPGWGIDPRDREKLLGLAPKTKITADTVLTWAHFQ